jgi:hypothetical protein
MTPREGGGGYEKNLIGSLLLEEEDSFGGGVGVSSMSFSPGHNIRNQQIEHS